MNRLLLTPSSRSERSSIEVLPGARRRKTRPRVYSLPADPRIFELAVEYLQQPTVLPCAAEWYNTAIKREQELMVLKEQEDTLIHHPKAHKLWPFQRVGVNYIIRANGALLADQCGLGKTATAIIAIEASKRDRCVLVVCPNPLKQWWSDEIQVWSQWGESVSTTIVPNKRSQRNDVISSFEAGWLIIHWEALRLLPQLRDRVWDWIILDEAHRIKNRKTKMYEAFGQLKTPRLLELTGTPCSNDVTELWTLLHLLKPDIYTSYWAFYEMYVHYIEGRWGREVLGIKNDAFLRRALAPVMIRRTKEQVLPELPAKRYREVRLDLYPKQKVAYRAMAKEALVTLGDREIEAPNVIAQIVRLKQLACSLGILGPTDESTKLDCLLSMIQDAPDEKWVVFTTFAKMLDLIEARLAKAGISFRAIRGGLGTEKVTAAVDHFQTTTAQECQVFAGTVQTGGVGLTLTAAGQLVFTDKYWNPATQEQAEDRIHRIGQHRGVTITSLHCVGTIDETIKRILQRKQKMTMRILAAEVSEDLRRYLA